MADPQAVAAAIAAQFATATAPAGEPQLRAFGLPPSGLAGVDNALVVWPPDIDTPELAGGFDRSTMRFRVVQYLSSSVDAPIAATRLYAWHKALRLRIAAALQFGGTVPGVAKAHVESSRIADQAEPEYDGEWDLNTFTVAVEIREAVTVGA